MRMDEMTRHGAAVLADPVPAAIDPAREPVSATLQRLASEWPAPRISLGEMIQAFGVRGYGLLIVLFAIPNLIPIYIPGWSPIFGIPLALVCLQMALGWPAPRLPRLLTDRGMAIADLQKIVAASVPRLQRIERWLHPRPSLLTTRFGERLIGAYGVWLAILVIVPLPGTNLPTSLACAIMAIGFLERDSRVILAGAAFGVLASAIAVAIIAGTFWVAVQGLGLMF
jgi:hypothetical protein